MSRRHQLVVLLYSQITRLPTIPCNLRKQMIQAIKNQSSISKIAPYQQRSINKTTSKAETTYKANISDFRHQGTTALQTSEPVAWYGQTAPPGCTCPITSNLPVTHSKWQHLYHHSKANARQLRRFMSASCREARSVQHKVWNRHSHRGASR